MEQAKKRTQINFDISPELHRLIKMAAINRNISMNLWLTRVIWEGLKKDKIEADKA